MDCIDLKERLGERYRVRLDREGYMAEPELHRTAEKPWHYTVACQNGEIYPHGGELLGASTIRHGIIAKRLAELDCVTVTQDGEDGINVTFHVDDFDKVAEVMKPRKRRRLSPEQRQLAAERLRPFRFPAAAQSDSGGLESTISVPGVS